MEVGVWDGNTLLTISLTLILVKQNLNKFSDFLLGKWYIVFLPSSLPFMSLYNGFSRRLKQFYLIHFNFPMTDKTAICKNFLKIISLYDNKAEKYVLSRGGVFVIGDITNTSNLIWFWKLPLLKCIFQQWLR